MNNDDIVSEVSLPIIHVLDAAFSLPHKSHSISASALDAVQIKSSTWNKMMNCSLWPISKSMPNQWSFGIQVINGSVLYTVCSCRDCGQSKVNEVKLTR